MARGLRATHDFSIEPPGLSMVLIDLKTLYDETAKVALLPEYLERARHLAGKGHHVILTGAAPIWLYLKIAHALHGKAKKLIYRSPVTGGVVIFDHDPF
jgi:CRISPR-associated protein Csx3